MVIKTLLSVAMASTALLCSSLMANTSYKQYPNFDMQEMHHKYNSHMYLYKVNYNKVKRHKHQHDFTWKSKKPLITLYPSNRYYAITRWHGRYKEIPMDVGIIHHSKRLYWQRADSGYVPYGAVVSGYSEGYPYFICQARLNDTIRPGKLIPARGCYINYHGQWHVRGSYLVLMR
jgi:DM9 repeat